MRELPVKFENLKLHGVADAVFRESRQITSARCRLTVNLDWSTLRSCVKGTNEWEFISNQPDVPERVREPSLPVGTPSPLPAVDGLKAALCARF